MTQAAGNLEVSSGGQSIQAFVPDPNKSQAPINLAGSKVFVVGPGGDYNITGWLAISITPSANNLTRYFNGVSTKTRTLFSGQENIIILDQRVTSLTISGTDPSVEIEGM